MDDDNDEEEEEVDNEEEEEEEEVDDKEVKSAEALTGGFLLLVTLPALRICLSSLASMDTNCWKDN